MLTITIILGMVALMCGVLWVKEAVRNRDNWELGRLEFVSAILFFVLGIAWFFSFLSITKVEFSEQRVSGIVYNTKNNTWPLGNTTFSIRAAADTLVTEENVSSYCLPPNSPYIKLVNDAAQDKSIKVIVTTQKYFKFVNNPFTCIANVKVVEAKQ